MKLSILASIVAVLGLASVAQADCDTGFDMKEVPATAAHGEVAYFICTPGGLDGDPDFGWSMAILISIDGREVRAHKDDVKVLRNAGIVR